MTRIALVIIGSLYALISVVMHLFYWINYTFLISPGQVISHGMSDYNLVIVLITLVQACGGIGFLTVLFGNIGLLLKLRWGVKTVAAGIIIFLCGYILAFKLALISLKYHSRMYEENTILGIKIAAGFGVVLFVLALCELMNPPQNKPANQT